MNVFVWCMALISLESFVKSNESPGLLTVSMSECEIEEPLEANKIINSSARLTQNDSTLILNGDVALFEDLDDSFRYDIEYINLFNGHGFRVRGILCDLKDFLVDLWGSLTEAAGAPSDCPIPAGEYHVEDFSIETKGTDFSRYVKGRGLLKAFVVRNQKRLLCREFYLE